MPAASRPSGRSASWARRVGVDAVGWLRSDVTGWLRSDVVDVVAVLPGKRAQPGLAQPGPRAPESGARSCGHLDEALARWSRRFARERRLVLAPRGLAFALSLGVLIAVVIEVSGSRLDLAVALWLGVPPLVGLAVVLASSWRDPSRPEVARVLDRDLALDERIGTAVEISGAGPAVDGLAALVLADADAALVTGDLSGARPTHRSAQREWLVTAGAALIIAGLLVLISGRGLSSGPRDLAAVSSAGHRAGPTSVAGAGGGNHARPITGRARNIGPDDRQATTPSLKSGSRNAALSVVTRPQSSTPGGRLQPGGGNQRTPPGAFGRPGSQTAGLGSKAGAQGASGGAGSRANSGSSAEASTHSLGSRRGGRAGSSRGAAGRRHTNNPQRVGAGSRGGKFDSNRTPSSRDSAKAQSSGTSQAQAPGYTRSPSAHSAVSTGRRRTAQGHSAGNGAGAGSGGNPLGPRQTKGLPGGFAGRLPIEASSTAARNRTGPKTGNPAGRSGGKGPARSATEDGRGSASAVTFPYIPPSADIGPADDALLRHYFSSASAGPW